MKISLCITVLNEEKGIGKTLKSVFDGVKKPDEVVVVDGGSTDNTLIVLKKFQKEHKNLKLFVKKGGIAKGRNFSIQKAKGVIIAQIDSGCVAKREWLQKITEPFKNKKTGMVAGFYEMPANSAMQVAINVFHGVPPQRFNPKTFLPSARSVAFRKAVWAKIGGYNEKLKNAGEDTLFFYEAVKNNFEIERVGEARVVWEEAADLSLKKSMKKFFNYAKGDAEAGIWWHPTKQIASHNIKISLIFIRYLIALAFIVGMLVGLVSPLFVLILVILYLIWPIYKWHDVIKDPQSRLWLPIIQLASDFAVMAGFVSGIL